MLIEGQFEVPGHAPSSLLQRLLDAGLMASCVPGCETLERVDERHYKAVIVQSLAGITARFNLDVEVLEQSNDTITTLARGEEGGQASALQARTTVKLEAIGSNQPLEGSRVFYASEVTITGRLGRFALGMMRKKSEAMGAEFARNLQAKLAEVESTSSAVPPALETPIERKPAPRSWWQSLWAWLLGRPASEQRP
jgi:uncharacterized protein